MPAIYQTEVRHLGASGGRMQRNTSTWPPEPRAPRHRRRRPMETAHCILIVEDNEVVRDMLAVVLQAYGYTVATAATVHEAEAAMQQRGSTAIGLVITDIHLTSDREAREGYALYQRWTIAYPRLAYLLTSG